MPSDCCCWFRVEAFRSLGPTLQHRRRLCPGHFIQSIGLFFFSQRKRGESLVSVSLFPDIQNTELQRWQPYSRPSGLLATLAPGILLRNLSHHRLFSSKTFKRFDGLHRSLLSLVLFMKAMKESCFSFVAFEQISLLRAFCSGSLFFSNLRCDVR